MRKSKPLVEQPAFVIITRACWCRGLDQKEALQALYDRGLWLSAQQREQAGLYGPWLPSAWG